MLIVFEKATNILSTINLYINENYTLGIYIYMFPFVFQNNLIFIQRKNCDSDSNCYNQEFATTYKKGLKSKCVFKNNIIDKCLQFIC